MNKQLRLKINEISDVIRDEFNIACPITNFDEIINDLGGTIEYCDELVDGAEAMIKKNGNGFIITVSNDSNKARQRFSIAHELGHLFLHMGYMIDEDMWNKNKDEYFRKLAGEMEYQAHEFAAAFLMPKDLFIKKMNEFYDGNKYYDMKKVADYFNVSLEAAINRGRWLDKLSW